MKTTFRRTAMAVLSLAWGTTAWADINGTQTLSANTAFNLDTGATASSGGDVLWNGSTLTPQGSATGLLAPGLSGQSAYAGLSQQALQAFSILYSSSPISGLTVNSIVAVKTNGGNYAKLLVTAVGGGSLTVQYTTYGASSTPSGPTITALQNNYSYILPGLPNYGIAPGVLFIIKGSGLNNQPLSALQSSAPPGLPLTLNGTSISVTVNGTTTHPPLYYTSPTQLAAVLPSNTPAGTGTITVTNNGQTSAAAQIQVVASALGLDTLYGTGSGPVVATDGAGNVLGPTNSASPGQSIILWGSGFGADASNDDRTYPLKQNNLTGIPLQIYVGGISASIGYRGRSQYPGVDQVNITVPSGALGCAVSVIGVSGSIVTNAVTLPVAQNGGTCSDPTFGISGDQLSALAGKPLVNFGFVSVTQSTNAGSNPPTTSGANALFYQFPGSQLTSNTNIGASIGSCIITPATPPGVIPALPKGLDAGSLSVTGPAGTVQLQSSSFSPGLYFAQLANSAIPSSGGVFTFNATGGKDVGAFTTALNFPVPLVWANMSAITSVNRAQGVMVTWTGGATGTYVQITGSATSQLLTVAFTCNAPVSAGQFTVPPAVLLALPAGNGSLSLDNSSLPQTFSASGLDLGFKIAGDSSAENVPYQ
jgi:uncharacterized protein (TIGR03437 family)